MAAAISACGGSPAATPDASSKRPDESLIVPAELSNRAALRAASRWLDLPSLAGRHYTMQSSWDRGHLEDPPVMLLENGNADMNQFVCKSDTADIRYPIFFEPVVDLAECPEAYVDGFVFARFEGSGTLARMWLTALSLFEARADPLLIRIYVDDEPTPVLRAKLVDLVGGDLSEIFAPPFISGLQTSLSWHYPMVFAKKLIISVDHLQSLDLFYHQTSVIRGNDPALHTPATEPLSTEREQLAQVWSAPAPGPASSDQELTAFDRTIPAGELTVFDEITGSGTITSLSLTLAETDRDLLASLRLQLHFDDVIEPAIDLSAAALFAAYDQPSAVDSLSLASRTEGDRLVLQLRLPMPFRSRVRLQAENLGARELPIALSLRSTKTLPAEPFGHLHAHASEMRSPASERFSLLDVSGPGRLIGTCMSMEGHAAESFGAFGMGLNFLEGDERMVIDGEDRVLGTGTEDYFDSAFYFGEGDFGNAFAQGWGIHAGGAGDADGRVSTCRWHLFNDAIDFESTIEFDLEVGPAIPETLDRYRSTVFFYQ